ncbi:MAG TPA: DUF1801 domain-containing protein [Ktedonobacterales bacterium]|jgi:uncharacterized protein YdhG (YjbR/CyaY superfamily)
MREANYTTVDEYIAAFPEDIRALLEAMRATIRAAAPDASERISYQIPTFTLHGNLVHYAAFKRHIGFYPTSSGITAFQDELAGYKQSRGAVQFPLDQPLPLELVARITRYRADENRARAAAKTHAKQSGPNGG